MSSTLIRLLKLAEVMSYEGDIQSFNSMCAQFDAYVRKHKLAHIKPDNDGTTPNPWKHNMDYSGHESSPYFGSISDFMKKFPGGIKDWVEWRKKTQKDRNLMYSKKAHFVPEGGDDVDKFENEPHLYSGDGTLKFKDIQEFIKKYREDGQSADDAAFRAVKDMVAYWKLLLKGKKRREVKK